MRVRIMQDSTTYSSKPTDVGASTRRLVRTELEIADLAAQTVLPYGRSWAPGFMNSDGIRDNNSWIEQQLFAVDFDNKESVIRLDGIISRCEYYNVIPAFIHETFSSTELLPKYRAVFVSPVAITNRRIRDVVQAALLRLFPESDSSVRDAGRLFYGGTQIVYQSFNSLLLLDQMFASVSAFIASENQTQAKRNVETWCRTVGLNTINGYPAVWSETMNASDEIAENSDSTDKPIIYYKGYGPHRQKLHFSLAEPARVSRSGRTIYTNTDLPQPFKDEARAQNVNWQELIDKCPVTRDFMAGVDRHHSVTFAVLTNFLWIKGGEVKFFEALKRRERYDVQKWNAIATYVRKVGYLPTRYDNPMIADYYDDVRSKTLATSIVGLARTRHGEVVKVEDTKYISKEKAFDMLQQAVDEALADEGFGIYVFKADTGVGKSTIIQNIAQRALIAVPRHDLKEQFRADFDKLGRYVDVTPEMPELPAEVSAVIDSFHRIGGHSSANAFLRNYAHEFPAAGQYLLDLQQALDTEHTLITTHARLPFTQTNHELIIVDEDPISTLLPQSSVRIRDLDTLVDLIKDAERGGFGNKSNYYKGTKISLKEDITILTELVNRVKVARQHLPEQMGAVPFREFSFIQDMVLKHRNQFQSDVLGFFACEAFILSGDVVLYTNRHELPTDRKILIFSATASESLLRMLFNTRLKFFNIPSVKLAGQFDQHMLNTSRKSMEDPIIIDAAKYLIGDLPVITHKKYADEFKNVIMHIGAVTGMNTLAGQDLAVVATPHVMPDVYTLRAAAMGYRLQAQDLGAYRNTLITHNGMRFHFPTYENRVLRDIQLNIVESELLQAIGRARAVRNDCKVVIVSNFPVLQATLHYYRPDEIKEMAEQISAE